jgi:hypothetical protein
MPVAQEALRRGDDPAVGDLGGWISIITGIFFFAKAISLAVGYTFILAYFWQAAT